MARALQPSETSQVSGVLKCLISLQFRWSNLRVIGMGRLNFSVNGYMREPRRRGYNPRRAVALRSPTHLSALYLFTVMTAMAVTFAIVWYA